MTEIIGGNISENVFHIKLHLLSTVLDRDIRGIFDVGTVIVIFFPNNTHLIYF